MKRKLVKFSFIILLFTLLLCFIYAIYLTITSNEKYFNIITLLLGIIFYGEIGFFSVKIFQKKFLLTSFFSFLIITLAIYIIKCLSLNCKINLITYKTLINFISTIFSSFVGKKKNL